MREGVCDGVPGTTCGEYYYESAAGTSAHGYLRPVLHSLLADVGSSAEILDLGCGNGSLTAAFLTRERRITGVDYSVSGIALALGHYPAIRFLQADVCGALPPEIRPGGFDAVMCCEVVEHVYSPKALMKNCYRLLRPGGFLILTTPYHGYLKNLALALSGRMDRHFTPLWEGGHVKFWSRRTLSQLLREEGFEAVVFRGAGRVPWLWKSLVFKARKPGG